MKLEHAALFVNDLEKAKTFFETYFEAAAGPRYHNDKTGFTSYFLSFDGGARLEIMQQPGVKTISQCEAHTGLIHLAFSVGSKEKVDALTKRLAADGYPTASGPRTTGDGYYESSVIALEENRIEITI